MVINIRQGTAADGGFIINKNIHITKRELEALALIGTGLSNDEAAKKLGVSINTMRNHIWNIMQKLGAISRAHAIVLAIQNGIIEVKYKRTIDTFIHDYDKYVLCIICGKVNLVDNYQGVEPKKVKVNHVEYEMDIMPNCPTEGCRGGLSLTIDWDYIRKRHPEYPEFPETDIVYDYDIEWFRGYPNE